MIIGDMNGAIAHLKEQIDISDVIAERTTVKDAGADMKKALCCFHDEKTPSLTITPSKGLYYCFGCHATGDIVSFYRESYGMSTSEAIDELAESFDVNIDQYKRELTAEEKEISKLKQINNSIADQLQDYSPYIEDRGVSEEVATMMKVGYSERLGDILADRSSQDLEKIGITEQQRRQWDKSIVYPQFDPQGDVIGFKNRPLEGKVKFLGTPTSSMLHLDSHIYGMHIARRNMKDNKLIVVEGQHDVLMAYTHGIMNVVGTDSTALNKAKIKAMEEYGVSEIVIAYDGDSSGREASLKIANSISEFDTNISIKIASLPDESDPDDYIREYGKVSFLQLIHEAVYSSQYIVDNIANSMPLNTATSKMDFIKKCEKIIVNSSRIEQAFIIDYIATKVGIDTDIIEDMIRDEEAKQHKSILYNIEAEKIVLNGMINDSDFRLECIEVLTKDDFYLYKHSVLYSILEQLDSDGTDINKETIQTEINNREMKQLLGGYLGMIYQAEGTYMSLLTDVIDKSVRRMLVKQSHDLERKAKDTKNNITFISEEHLSNVEKISGGSNSITTVETSQKAIKSFMDTLHERMLHPNEITGIELGDSFKSLTSLLNGIQKKKLITVAANQSVGKTTLVANMLNHIAVTDKIGWAHFSLEMSKEEMVNKIIGIRSGVNTQKIERGNVSTEEYQRIRTASIEYHEGNLFIIDDCTTLESIINKTRALMRKYNIQGISIDYMQLMNMERFAGKQKYEEEGQISGALKNDVAKKFDIPVINVSQMSRRALDREIQKAEDGQGAYKIAQDSDIYMILQDKSPEDIEKYGIEHGNQMLHLDKNRGGRADVLLDIYFDKDTQRMSEAQ